MVVILNTKYKIKRNIKRFAKVNMINQQLN